MHVSTPDSMFDPSNQYTIVRHDRQASVGGGVCAFMSKQYTVIAVDLSQYHELEICCFDLISKTNASYCRFIVVYRLPSCHDVARMLECLDNLANVRHNCVSRRH